MIRKLSAALTAATLALGVSTATAQSYPTRPVTWINPSAAGGPTDSLARAISDRMATHLGQPIVTQNIAGAGGTIGSAKAARTPADGYTMLVGHVGYMAAAVSLYKKLPYDPVADFDAVMRLPNMPGVLVVNPNAPFSNLAELVEYARKNPGKVNFADGGVGTMSNLVVSMFASRAGIEVTQISHKGNAPALVAVLGGHADAMIEPPNTSVPHVKAGKLRALAVTALTELDFLPGVPPVAKTYAGFDGTIWFGIYAPKGTPRPAIDRMHSAYLKVIGDPAVQAIMRERGMQLLPEADYAPDALQRYTANEVEKYREVIRSARIEPQ
jgi:tripartite-type tricarboxylate transporter receptor subunit TctC